MNCLVLVKKLPIVYDAHYSINELIKDVGYLRTSDLRPYHTSLNDNDQLSLKIEHSRIEPTGEFFRLFFCETRTKRSVEVYKGKNLDPPPRPLPHRP